jgi:hypothetical protein
VSVVRSHPPLLTLTCSPSELTALPDVWLAPVEGREPIEGIALHISITSERPDSADAVALIAKLEAELELLYPPESRHGLSVAKLMVLSNTFAKQDDVLNAFRHHGFSRRYLTLTRVV